MAKSWKKWRKVRKSGEGEKWRKVIKSGEMRQKVGKVEESEEK